MKRFSIALLDRALDLVTYLRNEVESGHAVGGGAVEEAAAFDAQEQRDCFSLIEDVLQEAKKEAETIRKKELAHYEPFPYDVLVRYEANENPQTITMLLKAFASLTDKPGRKMIAPARVNKWLQDHGYLTKLYIDDLEKEDWYPTDQGSQAGIHAAKADTRGQSYMRITYDQDGQRFLAEHLEEIEKEMLFVMQ